MFYEVKARVMPDGTIELKLPVDLPPGDIDLVVSYLTDEEAADEAIWDAKFAATPAAVFERMIAQVDQDIANGEVEDFDSFVRDRHYGLSRCNFDA
jgi:hypothetical protein